MKLFPSPMGRKGFTRAELVACLFSCAVLALIVLPVLAATNPRADRVQCLNQLRRIGQGFQSWANDHTDKFPWSVLTSDGGASDAPSVFYYFLCASNEFGTPKFLVCPADGVTPKTASWDSFTDGYLSYFAGLDADLNVGRSFLSGDRNLIYSSGSTSGLRTFNGTNAVWDITIHNQAGNLLLSDGSTVACSNLDLTNYLRAALAENPTGTLRISPPQH